MLSKKILFVFTCFSIIIKAIAQEDASQSMKKINEDINSIRVEVVQVKNTYNSVNNELTSIKNQLQSKYNIEVAAEQEQLTRKKALIVNSCNFVNSAHTSLKAIELSINQSTFSQEVLNLNNPTRSDLGFSLVSVIQENVKDKIFKDVRKGDEKAKKVNGFIKALIDNPITQTARSIVPAINSVVSFISSVSFNDKQIPNNNIDAFVEALSKYTKFYEDLSNANNDFITNLEQLKIRTAATNMLLKNYVIDKVEILYPEDDRQLDVELNDLIVNKYSSMRVTRRIEIIESEATKGAKPISKHSSFQFPTTTISQAAFINAEIEALSNQYINLHENYFKNVQRIIESSKNLEKAKEKDIEATVDRLTTRFNDWKKSFTNAINLSQNKENLKVLSGKSVFL